MEFKILDRRIGFEHLPLVVAEIGINHGGSLEEAIKIVDAAIESGAEAIKHQTHSLEDEMSFEAKFRIPGNSNKSIYEIIEDSILTEKEEKYLSTYVKNKGVIYFSTPFSRKSVDQLMSLDVPVFKIGSGECNNYPFVKYVAEKKKPVILSTGMNDLRTIKPSVQILEDAKIPFALLHCTNLYPTPEKLIRLNGILDLKNNFPNAEYGLSDHSASIYPALASVALGASIIEKHFTDSKDRIGPDISSSMDPSDLEELLKAVKIVHECKGGQKNLINEENVTRSFAFSSVVATRDIQPGETLTVDNIWVMRPAGGAFGPADYEMLLGKKSLKFAKKGFQLPPDII